MPVLVVDLPDGGRPEALAAEIVGLGGSAVSFGCDISQSISVKGMIDKAVELWGRLDIVVNNAMWMGKGGPSGGLQGSAVELAEESWSYAFDVGLKSQFLATKHAVPEMVKNSGQTKGAIVNISSVEGVLMSRRNLACECDNRSCPLNCIALCRLTMTFSWDRCYGQTRGARAY